MQHHYNQFLFSARCNIYILRLCYDVKCPSVCDGSAFLLLLFFLDPGTSFPGCDTFNKVCGVWNGYNGDSEIVKVLDRQTALKRWIAVEIRWYRNVVS